MCIMHLLVNKESCMNPEELPEVMFDAVLNGSVTKEEFVSWVEAVRFKGYCDGSDEANYQNAMNH